MQTSAKVFDNSHRFSCYTEVLCFAKRLVEWVMSISITTKLPRLLFIEVQYMMVSDQIQVPAVTASGKRRLRQSDRTHGEQRGDLGVTRCNCTTHCRHRISFKGLFILQLLCVLI
jgi:hypothetical protein